jgi:hypothetical protein
MINFKELREAKGKSKKEIKERAQDELMHSLANAFYSDEAKDKAVFAEMDKQMKRIEKLFGYKPGSWRRGG